MIVAEVIARLQAITPQPFRIIAGALELAAVQQQPSAVPAAYVFIETEAAEENQTAFGATRQRVESDLAVVIVAGNVAGQAGSALAGDIETLKAKVRTALVGWMPASASEPLTFVASELVRAKGGYAAAQLTFSAPYYLEAR